MASNKAASTCLVAKCAAEDSWLLNANTGPVTDTVLWKRMYKGIEVYKGRTYADKATVLPSQIRRKIQHMMERREHLTINGAAIILA